VELLARRRGLECETKGLALSTHLSVLGELRGDGVAAQVRAALSPELRALLAAPLDDTDWYPLAWKLELHRAGLAVTGDARLAWQLGRMMTARQLAQRSFISRATPSQVLALMPELVDHCYRGHGCRGPSLEVEKSRRGFTRLRFRDCHGFDDHHWRYLVGCCEATLAAAGAELVRMHVESGGGASDAEAVVTAWWLRDPELLAARL
jgi:hypothetical protein